MALNKYMHPRNLYKVPPDFLELCKSFKEFSNIAKVDVTRKLTIDFKNPHSLRVLTKCLLKSDFQLDVEIPEDRLVPTLPLRLNYILWIEDLLNSIEKNTNVFGIDIGTGACAIYPLLAATKNKWHMIGTENDEESLQQAKNNIERNNLQDYIKLATNTTKTIIKHLFNNNNEITYDFCMCNPPFYSSFQELCESRSPARPPPKNGFTGSPQELITEGGELTFCRKLISESKEYKDKVLIFTTMVGHKYNLKELIQDLKADGVKHTSTEFCQGRVTRWGLAWTYQDYEIDKLVPPRDKQRKKNVPIICQLPTIQNMPLNLETAIDKLKSIFDNLKLTYQILHKRGNVTSLDVKATVNTWSNQRRKRRQMKRLSESEAKKPKIEDFGENATSKDTTSVNTTASNLSTITSNTDEGELSVAPFVNAITVEPANIVSDTLNRPETIISVAGSSVCNSKIEKETHSDCGTIDSHDNTIVNECSIAIDENSPSKENSKNKTSSEDPESIEDNEYLVHAILKVIKKEQILLEFDYVGGTLGKEGLYQVLQYIKNNWKYIVILFQ